MEKKLSFEKKALSLQYQQAIDIFRAPRDISYYLSKNWIKGSVREKNTLIENLISLGILSEASTAEKLGVIFTGSDLKKLLKSYGQKTSGSKMELAKRLLSTDKEKYQEHVRDIKILKSSEHGKKLYRENEYLKESEFFHAQNERH